MSLTTRRSLIVVLSFALIASISALVSTKDGIAIGGSNGIVVVDPGGQPSLALDSAEKPVIAHTNGNGFVLRLLNCGNTTCTSGNVGSSPSSGAFEVSLDLDASGNPAVAFLRAGTVGYHLAMLRCSDVQCSSPTVTDTTINGPTHPSLQLDASDNPVIAADGLRVVACNDPECAGADESVVSPVIGYEPSLALDSAGNPVVAFRGAGAKLGILHCTDPACASSGPITYPDSGNQHSAATLLLDSSGNPIVTYFEFVNGSYHLKILHCGDPDCSSGNTIATPVAATGAAFAMPAPIALDQNGNPVVAYYNGNGALKLLRCGNPACSAGNSILRLDIGNAGLSPSLALNSSGSPIIAYEKDNVYSVFVVYCGSPSCDADDDGCADPVEELTTSGKEIYGGSRSPKNPYDYFNPTHDGVNRVDDILAVVDHYYEDDNDGSPGLPPYAPGYNPDTDRTLLGPDAWDTGPPNGLQRIDDILYQLKQYFHDCS